MRVASRIAAAVGDGLLGALLLLGIGGLVYLATLPTSWQMQGVLGAGAVVVAAVLNKVVKRRWLTLTLVTVSVFFTTRYIYWRATDTLGIFDPSRTWLDYTLSIGLFVAELYAWFVLLLGFVQTIWPLQRKPVAIGLPIDQWPSVDVVIPTYNEPLEVVKPTVLAALMLDWPSEKITVALLDDGGREEFKAFAAEVGVRYIAREEHVHAKAGNINHALTLLDGEYVAIFDSDHVPTRSFLQIGLGWFLRDEKLAMLQTPHHFYSPDPFERNLKLFRKVPNEGELFYGIVQDGNDLWNATFFCGSCAVLRRSALDQIGGIAVETVTEDAHTALKLQRRGWNTAYINLPQAAGLATESLSSHIGQRIRWARGMAQIFRVDNPLFGRGLRFMQRVCYLNAMLYFFFALPRLVFLTAPLAYLFFGARVIDAYAFAIAAYALPHLMIANLTNSRIQGKHRYSFWNEVYETTLAPYILLPVLLAVVNPNLGKFNVTAKGGRVEKAYFDRDIAKPFVALLALNLAGMAVGCLKWFVWRDGDAPTLLMNLLWTTYNLIMIGVTLAAAHESRQVRQNVRIPVNHKFFAVSGNESLAFPGETVDMSEGGALLRLPASKSFSTGDQIVLTFEWNAERFSLPAKVIGRRSDVDTQVKFEPLTLAQERGLMRLLYSRADAWIGFGEGARRDRPLKSFMMLSKFAVRGVLGAAKAMVVRAAPLLLVASALVGTPHVSKADETGQFHYRADLAQLGETDGAVLTSTQQSAQIPFFIEGNRVATSGRLHVEYEANLATSASVVAYLNGVRIGQIPLATKHGSRSFSLPGRALAPRNTLVFKLDDGSKCGNVPERLKIGISPASSVSVDGQYLRVASDLSELPRPFIYPGDTRRQSVSFAFTNPPDAAMLKAAGVIASWLGTLSGYEGVGFKVYGDALPSGNVVVFATSARRLPSGLKWPKTKQPALTLEDNPNDPFGKVLLVTGGSSSQILLAARQVALSGVHLRGHSKTVSLAADQGPPNMHAAHWLSPGKKEVLAKMRPESPYRTEGTGAISVGLRLPPDAYLPQGGKTPFSLSYRYRLAADSGAGHLSLLVNNHFVVAKRLGESGQHSNQSLIAEIPNRYLHAFDNTLQVEFDFRASERHACLLGTKTNAYGQILSSTMLDLSGIHRYATFPDLTRFFNGGAPFTAHPTLSNTAFVISSNAGAASVEAYLDLMALLGNQTGVVGSWVSIVPERGLSSVRTKNLIVLGAHDHKALWRAVEKSGRYAPESHRLRFAFGLLSHIPQPLLSLWSKASPAGLGALMEYLAANHPAGFIEEAVSPFAHNRVVLMLQAQTAKDWPTILHRLTDLGSRQDLYGDIALFSRGGISSFKVSGANYAVTDLSPWYAFRLLLARSPWLSGALLFMLALFLAVVLRLKLARVARRRLSDGG